MALTSGDEFTVDEYYIQKCMKDNYGLEFWLKAGGMYGVPNKGRFVYLISGLYGAAWIPSFPLIIITIYKTATGKDVEIFCEAIHFTIFIILEMMFLVSFRMKNKVLGQIFTLMGKGFYDYQNTLDQKCLAFIAKKLDETKRKKKLIAKIFIGVVMGACFSITILRPIMKFVLEEHLLGKADDGLLRLVPVTIWTPFNKNSWYPMLIMFILENIISFVTPGIVFGITLVIIYTCEDVGTQFIILGYTLKSVARRAKSLNMPREEVLKLCFSHSVRHHETLLTCIKALENILYFPGLGLLGGSTILMCMSGFIFVSIGGLVGGGSVASVSFQMRLLTHLGSYAPHKIPCIIANTGSIFKEVALVSKIVFGMFLLSELFMIFLICWCGENIQKTSAQILDMVYASEWADNMKSMKSYVLIIQMRAMRPVKISFGGIMDASLETYSNICSTAFSYFNLMLAVN